MWHAAPLRLTLINWISIKQELIIVEPQPFFFFAFLFHLSFLQIHPDILAP